MIRALASIQGLPPNPENRAVGFRLNLRSEAKQSGIHVITLCPGYLAPMHANATIVTDYSR